MMTRTSSTPRARPTARERSMMDSLDGLTFSWQGGIVAGMETTESQLDAENLRLREQADEMAEEIERLQNQIKVLVEEKRQLVVLCEAIGAKARSGEIPRFWER